MKKRLVNVSPLKLGITLAIIYGVMSLIFMVPFFLIFSLIGAASAQTGVQALPVIFTGVFVIFLPVIYAVGLSWHLSIIWSPNGLAELNSRPKQFNKFYVSRKIYGANSS